MFRIVDPPPPPPLNSTKQSASEWIYKMLFLWSKEPSTPPTETASSSNRWFIWFAAAILLWRCRYRISRAIQAASPLKLLKRRGITINQKISSAMIQQKRLNLAQLHKHKSVGIRRAKRLCTGDGPHVCSSVSLIEAGPQITGFYRVTRSGRIYGKYTNKAAVPNGGI
ncbi:uncharacterized protein LOC109852230 [Pseudomyrmex gracilis]|uniref:uncharacterized protein LOC109852230 n=1 Tax=Pseudomyrmex gracilis TaxID=219809 RepID=UPI000994CBE9|nr:uncharacterized protein LOC109852230 [Pseudomyrmex gracilis]